MTPASGVRENNVFGLQGYQHGIGFRDLKTPTWEYATSVKSQDWVGGYPTIVLNGKADFTVPAGLANKRERTAMGLKDNCLGIFVTLDGMTLKEVANKFISNGYNSVINLDGGGSSGYATPAKYYSSSRKLRGFVAIWLAGGTGNALTASSSMVQDTTKKNGVKLYANIGIFSKLNVRRYNDTSSAILATLKRNEWVTWYGYYTKDKKWYYIKT